MFEWKVEEMKLMNSIKINGKPYAGEFSLDEKIEAIDKYGEFRYKVSDYLEKQKLFDVEKDSIKKTVDWSGNEVFNTNSLRAWCKKNGVPVGDCCTRPACYDFCYNCYLFLTGSNEKFRDVISKLFNEMLSRLERKEKIYFEEHDELSILCKKINNYLSYKRYYAPKGVCLFFGTKVSIGLNQENGAWKDRPLTLEEARKLVDFFERLEKTIEDFYSENDFVIEY